MVANNYDFLTARTRRDHRLLRVAESAGEHVQSADVVGVGAVVAVGTDASERLSSPVFLRHQSTAWACPGGVSGVDRHKTNTVLLSQHFDPCNSLPICPWGDRLAEFLASAGFLSFLQVLEIFDTKDSKSAPRQLLNLVIDIVHAGSGSTEPALASRLASPDPGADSLEVRPVSDAVGIYQQLIDSDVDSKRLTRFCVKFRNPDPERCVVVPERAPLKELCSRLGKPMVEPGMRLKWNDDRISLGESGDLENVVERAFPGFDLRHETAQADGSPCRRPGRRITGGLGSFPRRDERLQGDLEAVGSMSVRKAASRNFVERCCIKLPRSCPAQVDVRLGTRSDFAAERFETSLLGVGGEGKADFDGAQHDSILQRSDGGLRFLPTPSLSVQPSGEAGQDRHEIIHEIGGLILSPIDNLDTERANCLKPREAKTRETILVLNQKHVEIPPLQKTAQFLTLVIDAATELLDGMNETPPFCFGEVSEPFRLTGKRSLVLGTGFPAVNRAPASYRRKLSDLRFKPCDRYETPSRIRNDRRNLPGVGMSLSLPERNPKRLGGFGKLHPTVHGHSMSQYVVEIKD